MRPDNYFLNPNHHFGYVPIDGKPRVYVDGRVDKGIDGLELVAEEIFKSEVDVMLHHKRIGKFQLGKVTSVSVRPGKMWFQIDTTAANPEKFDVMAQLLASMSGVRKSRYFTSSHIAALDCEISVHCETLVSGNLEEEIVVSYIKIEV